MSAYQNNNERSSYAGYGGYSRAPGSSHEGDLASPERLHSSQGFIKGANAPPLSPYQGHEQAAPGSSHGYPPQPPITPLSGSNYPPQPPPSNIPYYGLSTPASEQQQVPSPPASSSGRPESANFTPEGAPIVPVGISGGKMFRCRGYGDCDKVFTRSEHLARHVRKHTGERPFPCHCGKAFSRLDNLRQHSATVHADQAALNDAMLSSLAPVHAALSQRANRDQRKRGEIVEVPKNAVERPRHNEQFRKSSQPPTAAPSESSYSTYPPQDHQFTAPPPPANIRTKAESSYDYPYPDQPVPSSEAPGPSRRPASSYSSYPPVYYEQPGSRHPPTPGPGPEMSQLPYPYRPMSASGRDLPIPAHYHESEAPSSAHGPPPSPLYAAPPEGQHWSSPPGHGPYPPAAHSYPPPPSEGYTYPPPAEGSHYPAPAQGGYYPPPPPSGPQSSYYAPPSSHSYGPVPPPGGSYPPPPPGYGPPPVHPSSGPPGSPFHYHGNHPAPPPPDYGYYESRKRRADEEEDASRKSARPSLESQHAGPAPSDSRNQEQLWLPPTSERRSSLAISALLGSPQQAPRTRPLPAEIPPPQTQYTPNYTYTTVEQGDHGAPPIPSTDSSDLKARVIKSEHGIGRVGENMERKAKALLSQGR